MKSIFYLLASLLLSGTSVAQLPYTTHSGPPGLTISSARTNDIQVDTNNNDKWLSFDSFGLGIYNGSTWTIYNTGNSGLPTDSINGTFILNQTDAWIATKAGAVLKNGNNWTVYDTSNSGLPSNNITAVFYDNGITYFGTHHGLARFDGSIWTVYNTSNSSIASDSITKIIDGFNGDLYIGTRNGLSNLSGTSWTNYNTSNSILNRYIYDLEMDNVGRLWISSGQINALQAVFNCEIYYLESNQIKSFRNDFYSYDLEFTFINATEITRELGNTIVFQAAFSLTGRGMFKINDGTFEFYNFSLPSYGTSMFGLNIISDINGTLWVLPHRGFYFYSLDFAGYIGDVGNINYKNFRKLDINEVSAGLNVSGDMHWDLSNAQYEVPKNSGKNSVFSSAFWIGGIDQGGQLHTAAQTYRQSGNDFWPGPIDGMTIPFDTTSCEKFDQIWKLDKWRIEEFKNEFLSGNVTNGSYKIPTEIVSWPAKGNINSFVAGDLAPFVDFDNNGSYDAVLGDYPLIKGDQMLYYIFNDSLSVHTETDGNKLGVEVHVSAYSFYCPGIVDSNRVINRTTFYNYQIINKSQTDYDSVFIGLFVDCDLGNAVDDYVGCDTSLATGFTYNGDNDDEGVSGYGLNPPMQNVKILRGTLADPLDGTDNDLDGTIDEPGERTSMNHFHYYNSINNSPTGNPNGPLQFYNYMRSIWLDGQHVTYGGDGRNVSAPPTNFMFSSKPYSVGGWTEITAGNPPEDRRMLLTSGSFSLNAGDTASLDFAYVFTRDSLNPNGLSTSVARNIADLQKIQYWFDTDNFPSCLVYNVGLNDSPNEVDKIFIYPNPATDKLVIVNTFNSTKKIKFTIYNLIGSMVKTGWIYNNEIAIESLAPDMYILKLETERGSKNIRFVKM